MRSAGSAIHNSSATSSSAPGRRVKPLCGYATFARIELGAQQYTSSARLNEKPTVFIAVYQTPGSNALQVDQENRTRMAELAKRFPKGIAWGVNYDTTTFVSASMHDVVFTLGEALALVMAVVFLFLQSWRSTIIPAIAIPVSLIATLAVMLVLGFSLNTVSMLGMVLAIGLVVDDAIVVVENVERQLESGLSPIAAAVAAMREARSSPRLPCCWRSSCRSPFYPASPAGCTISSL
jgi:multidrug efflux pump subunit AcrB